MTTEHLLKCMIVRKGCVKEIGVSDLKYPTRELASYVRQVMGIRKVYSGKGVLSG